MKPLYGREPRVDPRHRRNWALHEDDNRRLVQSVLALRRHHWATADCTACDEDLIHLPEPRQN